MPTPEPWLRGPLPGAAPWIVPVLHSFMQVREDLQKYVAGMSTSEIWCDVNNGSIGFHMKHIAGSVDRLTAYLTGNELTPEQLNALARERAGSEDADSLIGLIDGALASCEQQLRTIPSESLYEQRTVGRKRLPTTVLGLLVHLAEHTQRHLGQIITLAKIVRQSS